MANTTRKKTAQDYLLENAARLEKISGKSVHYETGEKEAAPGSKKLARAVDGVKTKTADDAMRENAVRLEKISSAQRTFGLALQTADRELAKARNADRYTDRMAAAAADYARKADEMLNNGGRLRGETVGDMLKEIRPTVENRSAAQAALHNITEPGSTTPAQSVPVGRVPYAPVRVGAADRVPTAYDNATFTVKTGPGPYIEEFAQSQHDKMQAKAEEAMQEYAKYAPYRSDFAEVSARAGEDTKIKHTPEEAAKLKQERLNRQAIGGGILNPSASNEQELIDEWIDQRDVDTYNYLVNSGLKDYADAYWETVMADAQKKRTGEVQEFVKAAPDGFAEKALGSALSVGYNLSNEAAGGMYTIDQGVRSYLGDEKANISPYGVAFHGGWTRDALREDAMEGMGDVGKFIYQTGMSAADSMANLAFGSPLAPVMLGAGAMADTARDVKLRGGTDEQALGMGVVAGAAEILTEKMGFGRLGDLIGGTKGNVLRAVLGHMTSEFGEEAGTEIANLFADWAIMKDKSQYAQMVEEFGGGKEGTRRAWLEMLKQVGLSGLGGALSGAAMGGSSAAIGKAYQQMQNRSADRRLTQAIEKAAEQAAHNETAQNAPVDVSEAAMQVADRELGEEAGAAQAGAREATEVPAAQPRTEAANQTANQTVNQTVGEAPDAQRQQYVDAAKKYGEKYGDGAALVFARNYDGGDIQTYDRAFNALYTAGRAGLTLDKVGKVTDALTAGMSDVTKRAIMQAGANSTMSEVTPGVRRMYTVKATDVQKRQIAMLNEIGRKYGVEIDVVDSIRAGDYAANGMYNGGRKIVVALDAAEGAIVQAGVHELTHYLKRTDTDAYNVLRDVVLDHLGSSGTFDLELAIGERMKQYAGQQMTREDIIEEIVSEAVPTFLTDEKAVRAFVSENRPLAQKIRDFFVKFAQEIREIAERYMQRDGAERYEIANLLGRSDALTEIARTFDAALETASMGQEAEAGETVFAKGEAEGETQNASFSLREELTPVQTRLIESNKPVSGLTEAKWSLARNEEFMDDARKVNAKTGNVDAETMDEAAEARAEVKAYMEEHGEAMRLPADIEGNTFFADGAYGGSEESTSVCIRSMAAQELMDLVAKDLGRPLTVEDTLVISQDIAGYTDKPECYYCYVAQDRRAIREFLGTYMQQRDDVLKRYRAGEDRNRVYQDWLDGRKDTKNMRDRFAMWTKAVDNGDTLIAPKDLASMEDLNAEITTLQARIAEAIGGKVQFAGLGYKQNGGRTKGFASVLKTADAAPKADINRYIQLADALQYAKSASWAKKQSGYAAYNGHILKWSADKVKGFNDHYGLRMYSFSDFSPAFILENMQMITDAAVKGLKVLAYTKELDFVRVFAPTGANINISVFAQEINGQITSDGMMGADWAEAIRLREKYPNVGVTFVATSDKLAAWAEAQDWIDTVIPYHLVRTGTKVANYFGYKNYTAESSDKKKPGIKFKKGDVTSIPPEMHGNDIVRYVRALEEHNLTPRFESRMVGYREFLAGEMSEDEFRAANPYYMKYVNETRRSAQETPIVQPKFEVAPAITAMENLIKEGGYGAPIGQSYEVMQEIAEEIADKIRAGADALNGLQGVKFSLNTTSPATSITDENQNLSLPVDVKVDARAIADHAKKALVAGLDSGLTERMQLQIKGVANKIMRETGSSYSKETFADNMEALVRQYAEGGWTEETLKAVTEMAKKIIETSERADNSLREQYADVRKRLKESGVALTETQKQEAANIAGGYGEYRKSVFGTVNLKDDGMTLESLWNELSEQHPEIFTPGANEGDQVRILQEFAYLMRLKYENPYGMDMDGAALEMAMRIEGDVMGMIGAKDAAKAMYGSAEKLRSQFEQEYKKKIKQQKAERVQKFQQIAADLKAAKAKGDSAEQAKIMSRYRAAMKSTGLDEAYAEIRATLKAREEAKAETAKSREMREKIAKQASELMNMLTKPPKGKRIPTGLQQMVIDTLDMLDINGAKAAETGRDTVQAKEFREKLSAIREFYTEVASKQSAGEVPAGMDGLMMAFTERNLEIMNEALDVLGGGDKFRLRDMNSEQLKSLSELMKNIRHTVDSVGKMWKNHRYQSVVELGNASIEEMDERGQQKINETSAAGKGRDFLALDMMEPVSYGERLGEAGSTVIQSLMDGEKEKFAKVKAASEATEKMLKDTGVTGYDIGKWQTHVQTVKFGSGKSVRMTDAMIMGLYLTAQRPQGMQHLLGNGLRIPTTKETGAQAGHYLLTEADLAMIAGLLTDKQRRLADAMQAYLSTDVAKWGNDVTQRLYLYDAFTEGKYWPITSDPNVLKTQEPEGDRAFNAIINAGFTKPLNQMANNPVIISDAFETFGRHIGEMASYAGYAEVMTDTMAWINYRQRTDDGLIGGTVKESMERLLGSGGVKYLTKLVQDINGARRGGDSTQLAGLLRNYKIAAVAGKIRVAMQQPTSIVRAAAEINPIYLLRAMKPTRGSVREMQKWSSLAWWKANGNYDIGIGKGTDEILWGKTKRLDAVMEKVSTSGGLVDPGKMDDLAWSRIWEAAKLEIKRKRKDLKVGSDEYFRAVTERFEAICDRTQVVDTVMHRSDLMRSKDGLTKSLTSFMSEPTKSYNMLMRSLMDVGRNPKSAKAYRGMVRTGMAYVASVAANAAATALFDALKYRDDDDPLWEYLIGGGLAEDWTEQFVKAFMSGINPLENIPIISDMYAALTDGEETTLMEFQLFTDVKTAWDNAIDYFRGENKKKLTFYGAVSPTVKVVSEAFGLPFSGLMANMEMLAHAYDPKLLQTKSDMQTMGQAYDKLYRAMADGNRKEELAIRTEIAKGLYGNDAKSPKDIDTGIAEALAWNDERILRAWQLKQKSRIDDLTALYKTIQRDGFTDAVVKKAANRVESLMNTKYNTALEEGKAEEAEAIRAKAAKYGMVLNEKAEKNMDEELEAKTIEYKQLFDAIRSGDTEDIGAAAEIMEAESDAKNPAQAIRSQVTGEFKQEYVDLIKNGKTKQAEELGRKLDMFDITEEDRARWTKDSYRDDLKQAVRDGDLSEAERLIETLKDEYELDNDSLADSLTSEFKQEYIDLVMDGRDREADALAEKLQDLGIKYADGSNRFKQANLNKWVKDWEKEQEENE